MCVAQTARRRRRQAANGYKHLSPLKRPHYSKISAAKSARREAAKISKIKQMQGRKKQSK